MGLAAEIPMALPAVFDSHLARRRIAAIAASHLRLTGQHLVSEAEDIVTAMWQAEAVILAHGLDPDPLFFFANRAGLTAFETTVGAMLALPSRLSAEPALRDERARLLERVTRQGFIDDYAGIRISALGRRFPIDRATVWNVTDEAGNQIGQAATFAPPAHVRL